MKDNKQRRKRRKTVLFGLDFGDLTARSSAKIEANQSKYFLQVCALSHGIMQIQPVDGQKRQQRKEARSSMSRGYVRFMFPLPLHNK
jgi:hypothetical protein